MRITRSILTIAACTGFVQLSLAQDSGFLTDYSKLKVNTETGLENVRSYLHPDGFKVLAGYQAIMIDQPEMSIAADSKKQSLKPDDLVQLAEAMRAVLNDKLTEDYFVVDQPGPGVLLLRTAATNLYLKKAKRGLLSYTPGGAVMHAVKKAATDDITKKISFVEISVEAELSDSVSGEILAAFITQRGQRKDKEQQQKMDPSSWDEVLGIIDTLAARLDCRVGNARMPEADSKDCIGMFPEPVIEQK